MSKYYIASLKTGFMVDSFDSFDEALEALGKHSQEGNEAFQIVDEDHHTLHRYIVTIPEDGKYRVDVVIERNGYTEADYARDHGLGSPEGLMVSIGDA